MSELCFLYTSLKLFVHDEGFSFEMLSNAEIAVLTQLFLLLLLFSNMKVRCRFYLAIQL